MEKYLHYPKLRWPIELKLQEIDPGKPILVISCPLGIVEQPLCLIPETASVIQLFDGQHSIQQIANQLSAHGATPEIISQIAELLDSNLFLDGPRFHAAETQIKAQFQNLDVRPAARAGYVYAADAAVLGREIDRYLVKGKKSVTQFSPRAMIGLMAPHIDYRRGGVSYGKTYAALRDGGHDLYILMGTAHQYSELLFHLTKKDFDCPLGAAACHREFVESLADRYGHARSFQDEFLHKDEHSLELQIPFLQRVQQAGRIVPILVGGFHHMISSGQFPEAYAEYDEFVEALAELVQDERKAGVNVCFIAGVDMAHVGRSFGDTEKLSRGAMKVVEERDREYLNALIAHDKEALFRHIAEDRDARRICGFPTMYTVLDILERLDVKYRTNLFDYSQTVDYKTDCAVTFAGMGMYTAEH